MLFNTRTAEVFGTKYCTRQKILTHMVCKEKNVIYCKLYLLGDVKMTSTAVPVLNSLDGIN